MGVALTVVPWVIWFIFRPKYSTDRLLYVGLMVMVFSMTADVLGDQFALWHYRFNVIPILPTYIPWDLTLMPVTIMLILQIKPNSNVYLKALLFALISSYIAEPIFHWLGVYNPKNWRYTYSVMIQFLLFLAANYMLKSRNEFEQIR
nr:CBO0543 family protein [Paenibacillus soyae]